MEEFKDIKIDRYFRNQGRFYRKISENEAISCEDEIVIRFKNNSPVNEGY